MAWKSSWVDQVHQNSSFTTSGHFVPEVQLLFCCTRSTVSSTHFSAGKFLGLFLLLAHLCFVCITVAHDGSVCHLVFLPLFPEYLNHIETIIILKIGQATCFCDLDLASWDLALLLSDTSLWPKEVHYTLLDTPASSVWKQYTSACFCYHGQWMPGDGYIC